MCIPNELHLLFRRSTSSDLLAMRAGRRAAQSHRPTQQGEQSLWRNRLARSAVNRKVGGSSPPRDERFYQELTSRRRSASRRRRARVPRVASAVFFVATFTDKLSAHALLPRALLAAKYRLVVVVVVVAAVVEWRRNVENEASPSGNRTPVSRVTGGDTYHYTNEDLLLLTTAPPNRMLGMCPPLRRLSHAHVAPQKHFQPSQ